MRTLRPLGVALATTFVVAAAFGADPDSADPKPKALATDLGKSPGAVAVSPDGKFVLAGESSGVIRVYDATTEKLRRSLVKHRCVVEFLAFAGGDGEALVSRGNDIGCYEDNNTRKNQVCFWRFSSGTIRTEFDATPTSVGSGQPDHHAGIVAASPTTSEAVIRFGQERLTVYDVNGKRRPVDLSGEDVGLTFAIAFSPDGLRLVGVNDRTATTFSRTDAAAPWKSAGSCRLRGDAPVDHLTRIAFSADGKSLFGHGPEPTAWGAGRPPVPTPGRDWLCAWETATGVSKWEIVAAREARNFVVSPRGDGLIAPWGDDVVVLDPANGKTTRILPRCSGHPWYLALSPDGRFLYATTLEGTLVRWDLGLSK
jgi:WD40 repeat protein